MGVSCFREPSQWWYVVFVFVSLSKSLRNGGSRKRKTHPRGHSLPGGERGSVVVGRGCLWVSVLIASQKAC